MTSSLNKYKIIRPREIIHRLRMWQRRGPKADQENFTRPSGTQLRTPLYSFAYMDEELKEWSARAQMSERASSDLINSEYKLSKIYA